MTPPRIPPRASRSLSPAFACFAALAIAVSPLSADVQGLTGPDLRNRAVAMAKESGDFSEGANYLLDGAEDLDDRDVEKAKVLQMAGRLFHHDGDLERARETTLRAGEAAYEAGDGVFAANLFVDAAQAAIEDERPLDAWSAVLRAWDVLHMRPVGRLERAAILGRVRMFVEPALPVAIG